MGRSPCCEKVAGLRKGTWTSEEDHKLLTYIQQHGHGSWRALPAKAGLKRCGKSCRLRWTNYLRPDIKRGKLSLQEEQTIIQLHALLGNRWSAIATHLPKRTDNEIKNYWNTHLKKRLSKMGIDPATHKPKAAITLSSTQQKDTANLCHLAQWEIARLEAESRLVRESKETRMVMSGLVRLQNKPSRFLPPCLDILKVWQGTWTTSSTNCHLPPNPYSNNGTLLSPTSTLNFSDNNTWILPPPNAATTTTSSFGQNLQTFNVKNPKILEFPGDNAKFNVYLKHDLSSAAATCDIEEDGSFIRHGDFTGSIPGGHNNNKADGGDDREDGGRRQNPTCSWAHDLPGSCSNGAINLEDDGKYWNNILDDDDSAIFSCASPVFLTDL